MRDPGTRILGPCAVWLVAASCSGSAPPATPPQPPRTADAAPVDAAPAAVAPDGPGPGATAAVPPDCAPDERRYGSACCRGTQGRDPRDRFPGMTFLSCHGPRIGAPCRAKTDCDVACSCDAPDELLRPGDGAQGPADGTTGVVGHCQGALQIGVWMCQLDEHGRVSRVIVD